VNLWRNASYYLTTWQRNGRQRLLFIPAHRPTTSSGWFEADGEHDGTIPDVALWRHVNGDGILEQLRHERWTPQHAGIPASHRPGTTSHITRLTDLIDSARIAAHPHEPTAGAVFVRAHADTPTVMLAVDDWHHHTHLPTVADLFAAAGVCCTPAATMKRNSVILWVPDELAAHLTRTWWSTVTRLPCTIGDLVGDFDLTDLLVADTGSS
jgi:hypothetical protein